MLVPCLCRLFAVFVFVSQSVHNNDKSFPGLEMETDSTFGDHCQRTNIANACAVLVSCLCRLCAVFVFVSQSVHNEDKSFPGLEMDPDSTFGDSCQRTKIVHCCVGLLSCLCRLCAGFVLVSQSAHSEAKCFPRIPMGSDAIIGEPCLMKIYCSCLCRACAVFVPSLFSSHNRPTTKTRA